MSGSRGGGRRWVCVWGVRGRWGAQGRWLRWGAGRCAGYRGRCAPPLWRPRQWTRGDARVRLVPRPWVRFRKVDRAIFAPAAPRIPRAFARPVAWAARRLVLLGPLGLSPFTSRRPASPGPLSLSSPGHGSQRHEGRLPAGRPQPNGKAIAEAGVAKDGSRKEKQGCGGTGGTLQQLRSCGWLPSRGGGALRLTAPQPLTPALRKSLIP